MDNKIRILFLGDTAILVGRLFTLDRNIQICFCTFEIAALIARERNGAKIIRKREKEVVSIGSRCFLSLA